MQTVLGLVLAPIKWIAGLLLPIFARPRIPAGLFWFLHILVLALVFGGLFYLQHYYDKDKKLEEWMPNVETAFLRENFLLILAVLIYVFAWLAVWLWKIWLEDDTVTGEFPDIDEAWKQIEQALRDNGIRLDDAPLFLVVGHASLSLERLFKGLPRECALTGVTASTAPLRLFGGRDALYLACPGVSLVSKAQGHGGGADLPAAGSGAGGGEAFGTKTIGVEFDLSKSVGADAEEVARIMRNVQKEGRLVSEDERAVIRNLSLNDDGSGPSQLRPNVVQNAEFVGQQEARMQHFCKLLMKARKPFTPLNGAALLVSMDASENEGTAQKIALGAQKDLKVLQDTLKLHFPVFVLLADLEKMNGASAFLSRFPEERRKNRLGRGFPLAPDLTTEQYPQRVEKEVEWIFAKLLPFWCFRFFRLATPNVESHDEAVQMNGELFRFLAEVQNRSTIVGKLIAKAVQADEDSLPHFGGCYVVAQSGGQPWFTQDLFSKLEAAQNYVSWSQAAFDEDDDYKAWTWYGYGFLLIVWVAIAALAFFVYRPK
ncbi:MAG: type VI secretion protein IcmF/TssM N-terminal domain-containing protein [Gemmatales bacterium]